MTHLSLPCSSEANAVLQEQFGEANTACHAKEEECGKLATKRDLLAAQLAEQKEMLKKAQDEAEKKEAALLAEFESERSSWTDREAMLTSGFHEIEDIVDGKFLSLLRASDYVLGRLLIFLTCFFFVLADFFPGHSQAATQAIKADREARRADGAEIAANAPEPLMSSF